MDFKNIHETHTPEQAAELLLDIFDNNKEYARSCVMMMKYQIPQYIGNLNPLWKYWDSVATVLFGTNNQDIQIRHLKDESHVEYRG
jgi:hypothetical protein